MRSDDWLLLCRTVRFGDTDAAGVMHFVRLLDWCHQSYEESLERFGIEAASLFPRPGQRPAVALPIVHCSADFRRPLYCGDPLAIRLETRRLDPGCFEVSYRFSRTLPGTSLPTNRLQTLSPQTSSPRARRVEMEPVANGLTRHVAIDSQSRQRCNLPEPINCWLEASGLGSGVQPL
jgi:1,4-dihydroxy-2-naphthoyl-CoA hydrolase